MQKPRNGRTAQPCRSPRHRRRRDDPRNSRASTRPRPWPLRRPTIPRQLLGAPHPGPARVLPAPAGARPDGGRRDLPRCLHEPRNSVRGPGPPPGASMRRSVRIIAGSAPSISSGCIPPYWQMVRYNPDDPRCLSNAASIRDFVAMLRLVLRNCVRASQPGRENRPPHRRREARGRIPRPPFRTMNAAAEEGFWLAGARNHPLRLRCDLGQT